MKVPLTPVEQSIMDLLIDRKRHFIPELLECLQFTNDAAYINGNGKAVYIKDRNTIAVHIKNLRKKIRDRDIDVICRTSTHGSYYQLVFVES